MNSHIVFIDVPAPIMNPMTPPAENSRCKLIAVALAIQFFALFTPAHALDATRALTQSLHRIWQVQQGLPQGTIYSILQTSDGYLWLGTQSGLVRFDGIGFTTVYQAGGISLDKLWIQDLLEDADHNLWLATAADGLYRLHDGAAVRYTKNDGLPSDSVQCLMLDHRGILWVSTNEGIVNFVGGKFVGVPGVVPRSPHGICESEDGTIWVGGDGNQISVWNGAEFVPRTLTSVPATASVRAVRCVAGGIVWIGTSNGLIRLKGSEEHRIGRSDGLADDSVICLADSADGSLFVGTKDGFSRVRGGEIESFRTQDGLSQSTVFALRLDREGSLWVGTKHGLNQFLDRRTVPFTASEGLPSNDTGPVCSDSLGNMWVGTIGAGLSRFDGHHFSVLTTKDGLSSDKIFALLGDDHGGLWIGTDRGINHLEGGHVDRSFTTAEGLPSNDVHALLFDAQGALWVGTSAGVASLRGARFIEPTRAGGPLRSSIHAMANHAGLVFIAAGNGQIFTCQDDKLQLLPAAELATYDVDAFLEDSDSVLWMGTRGGGLLAYDEHGTRHYGMKDGLYDDDVYGIVADSSGNLWVGCSKGIFSVSRADLRKYDAGLLRTLNSTPFSPTDQQRTIECKSGVQPATAKSADGQIWFATIHGVIVVDPGLMQRKVAAPPIVIEEAIINGNSVNAASIPALAPGPTNVEFRYTGLSYVAPARMLFRYKLEGFDKDWIDAGQRREAFYTNLPPGNYQFLVTAGNIDGTWSAAASPVVFRLPPQFYQRRWFLPLCAVMALWGAWVVYRLRVRRIREQLHAVVTERSRIARELHDTLMQGFSGITMEMQALSTQLEPSPQRNVLQEIIQDAGVCLREARQSIAGLRTNRDARSGLINSIEQATRQIVESKDVRLRLKLNPIPRYLPAEVEYNLLRIAQEAVSNAVKHSGARTIDVALDSTPRQLNMSIKDDGIGMRSEAGQAAPPGHYGLIGMRERAAQIGAEFRLDSDAGRGTRISIELPFGRFANGPLPDTSMHIQEVNS
jgi:signal transduction histidine kinase/ligand-binding sensor domain-containing protein